MAALVRSMRMLDQRDSNGLTLQQRQLERALVGTSDDRSHHTTMQPYLPSPSQLRPLLHHLETELRQGLMQYCRPVLEYCGFPTGDQSYQSLVDLVECVTIIVRENEDRFINMYGIMRQVRAKNHLSPTPEHPPAAVRQGIFGVFGYITMLYKIPCPTSPTYFTISEPTSPFLYVRKKVMNQMSSPLSDFIEGFGNFIPKPTKKQKDFLREIPQPPASIDLSTSIVNAFVLTKIGELKITWSDLLSAHLVFDRYSRTLTMFKFPTFCALQYWPTGQWSLFDWCVRSLHGEYCKADEVIGQYFRRSCAAQISYRRSKSVNVSRNSTNISASIWTRS
ncbi:MAG: hypothetical protein Q9174_003248 [Haloplaca sp. 1 TL-2023]